MSKNDKENLQGFDSEDKDLDEDYYFDEIDDTDEDYFLDEEISEEDEDYFLDDEEAGDAGESSGSVEAASVEKRASQTKTQEIPGRMPVSYSLEEEPDSEDIDIFEDEPEEKKTEKRKSRRKKGRQKRSMKKIWIVLGSIVAVLAAAYIGVSVFFMSHFFMNTEINGHDFSGKSVEDVVAYMKKEVKDYSLTIHEKDGKTDTIDGTEISLTYKENNDIKKALEEQNSFLWPVAFFSPNSAKVTVEVSYDTAALESKIQNLQAVTAEQVPPTSATPKFDGEKFVIEPEVTGTAVNMEVLKEKVNQYISKFNHELDMEKEECYAVPKYTSESEEVQKACDTMNNYTKASITYTMSEPAVVDKALISTWLSVDENMNVNFNEEAVRAWLTEFGDKYDTVGTTRTITTPDGKTTEVSGGTYGWSIDEETEFTALTNSIKNGETVEKEPAYYQTAASHGEADWGNTYAEVDLSAQRMWYVVDGAVVLATDVVTGFPTPDKETPSGVYNILELERNKTLVGEIVPETGKPEYETPVSFWMRITWTGIGFHDATWQPAFGGSLYTTVGSHGCINMPYDQAEALYNMLSIGVPVIMHY